MCHVRPSCRSKDEVLKPYTTVTTVGQGSKYVTRDGGKLGGNDS